MKKINIFETPNEMTKIYSLYILWELVLICYLNHRHIYLIFIPHFMNSYTILFPVWLVNMPKLTVQEVLIFTSSAYFHKGGQLDLELGICLLEDTKGYLAQILSKQRSLPQKINRQIEKCSHISESWALIQQKAER